MRTATAPMRSRVRLIKNWAKGGLRKVFEVGQRVGVDILPRHFYSEVPDIRALKRDRRWQRPYSLVGVAGTDIDTQLNWLRTVCTDELAARLPELALYRQAAEANGAPGYGPVETDLLYCFIYNRTPRRMIQVGAGASTWVALRAASDANVRLDITAVDPYPTDSLRQLHDDGQITLRNVPVQAIPPLQLAGLSAGDVLFIDSTHTVSPGSDVNFLILEVLPRLRKGVFVHFHDITMPYDYNHAVLTTDLFFWSESVLLHAYLADNPRFAIRFGGAMVHDAARERAQQIIPTYRNPLMTRRGVEVGHGGGVFPSAMWLEVVDDPSLPASSSSS